METANAADGTQAALPLQTRASVTPEDIMIAADLLAQQQEQPTIRSYTCFLWGRIATAGGVDIKDRFGYTALQLAASRQLPGAVKVLLAARASVSLPFGSKGGNLLLEAAVGYGGGWERGHPELDLHILQCLAPAAAAAGCLDAVNARGRTALGEVVDAGYSHRRPCLASVRVLLAAGADPNAAGDEVNRPLRVAVRGCGKEDNPQGAEIVAALLDAGADPKAVPGQYGSPMYVALSSTQVEVVGMLLEAGACSTGEALADVIRHICVRMARGMDSGSSGLRNLQLLLSTQHPQHAKLTALQVHDVLPSALGREGSYPAAVQLLRYLHRLYRVFVAGGSAAEALSGARVNDPAALRVALLQGWAAATAEGDAERAAMAADEQGAAAASSGFREMLLGVAELEV